MKYTLREIYFYAVSFATLMMVIVGLYQLVDAGLNLLEPQAINQPRLESRLETELRFKARFPEATPDEIAQLVDEEAAGRDQTIVARERYWRLRRLIGALAFIAIAFPIYRYHWRQVKETP